MDLEELARLINGRWPGVEDGRAEVDCRGQRLVLWWNDDLSYLLQGDDDRNSRWIIWGLDRLGELLAYQPVVTIGKVETVTYGPIVKFQAPTRAEAVARALLETLREAVNER